MILTILDYYPKAATSGRFQATPLMMSYGRMVRISKCNKCKLPVAWTKTTAGKPYPVNMDGSEHWDICKAEANKGKTFKPVASDWIGTITSVYCGTIPVWEFEGEFIGCAE